MKSHRLSISVKAPCSEQWEYFTPSAGGRLCDACCKEVIDFTQLSDREIIDYFTQNPGQTCGRFRSHQLRQYPLKSTRKRFPGVRWVRIGFIGLPLLLWTKEVSSERLPVRPPNEVIQLSNFSEKVHLPANDGHIIRGVVKDEYGELLPGVSIVLRGSSLGTITDLDGRFQFPEALKPGDVLTFSFVGYESREYVVPKNAPQLIEIPLILDFDIMGEVAIEGLYELKPTWWQRLTGVF